MTAVRPCKIVECGLEVPRGVVYQGWEPGGEYTKPLVMKNVQLRTQRINYTIKGDQFHSAVYPRPIVLSAGMSYALPIVFKPRRKESCEQCIELETAEGAIAVSLKAVLPHVTVSLPESLKFGLCAVQDSLCLDFQISNTSSVGAHFSWDCPSECFAISPSAGELLPNTSCKLSATFTPDAAKVYSVLATCSYGKGEDDEQEQKRSVELKGVGKYPHVVVRLPCSTRVKEREGRGRDKGGKTRQLKVGDGNVKEGEVDLSGVGSGGAQGEVVVEFGSVAVGTSAEKWIELINVSAVTARVAIAPSSHSQLNPSHFTSPQPPSPLPPHSSHRLPLTFSPTLPSPHSAFAFFDVTTQGGLATTTVKCVGVAKAPRVAIEEEVLDFGNVPCGQSTTAVLHVKNCSDVTALVQLLLEAGSVFHADSRCIKLAPHSSHKIPLHFTPHKPVPHHKRITCLAQHQEPLFVHVIGTAYSETIRPVVLQPKHIKEYISNAHLGISKLPPERVTELLKDSKLSYDKSTGLFQSADTDLHVAQDTTGEAPTSPFSNYLHSEYEPSGITHISMDSHNIQFGCVSPHSVSEGKSLHVTNHTEGTVCCVWMTGSCSTFSVVPEEREIAPGTTCLFTAHFKPRHPGQFYFEELECYVFYKCLQSYQSVSAITAVTPPWCLCVRAQGHSFLPNTHTFTPKLVFETRDVVFPASGPLEPAYRSMTIWNDGDTPALFEMNLDPKQIFTIKPLSGLIPQGQYQTFVMEMMPREAKTYRHITHCTVNASSDYTQELLLSGTAEVSPIILQNQGRLFFKPTCVGASSSASYKITNTAPLPLRANQNACDSPCVFKINDIHHLLHQRYEWKVSGEGSEVITMEPSHGVILPSESQTHQWQFSPLQTASLEAKAVLHASVEGERDSSRTRRQHKAVLDLFGQGLLGEIQCHPSSLQFGTLVMGTSHTHTITLFNPSLCTLHYSLSVQHTLANNQPQQEETQHGVRLDPCEGKLHARSSEVVRVIVRPAMTTLYGCAISYRLISTNPAVAAPESSDLCTLEITGAYPSLAVTDVHGVEVASGLSKTRLWEMLSIDRLNGHLQEDPCPSELRYAIATRLSMRRTVSVHTRAVEEFHFGAAPLDSGCSVVHLVVENRGRVDTQWGFQFPSDMHLEPEYWADTGNLNEVERHHHDIITNQLFTVTPKTGRLAPGERVSILCSFKHSHIGSSKLPVLLKINRGREILLNWSGVTVERSTPYVFFYSHHHSFHPVPIGLTAYPTQIYELHNAGEKAVSYEVDTSPLHTLTHSNYLMPILQCLCAQGEVPPHGTAAVPFIFSPLEAKRYSVDVPILFSTGESVLVTFSGDGLDPNTPLPPSPNTPYPRSTQSTSSGLPVSPPGQLAALSTEYLSLGSLPLFSPVRRIVFLSNLHRSHTISFHWSFSCAEAAEVVSIHPAEGSVEPGRSCVCRVTFCSHSSSATYDVDIICKVVDESEVSEYQGRLRQWAMRQEENKHLFTISHPTTGQHKQTVQASVDRPGSSSNSDPRGSRYPVLPPIGAHSPDVSYGDWKKQDLSIRSKTRPRAQKASTREPPCPPTPHLLHLGIAAHTHSLTDYANMFGDLDKFYIDPQTQISPPHDGGVLFMKTEERDLILSLLGQIARELLDDSDFHTSLERVQHEPVPYFTQFGSQTHPPPHTDTPRTGEVHTDDPMHHSSSTHSISQSATEILEGEVEKECVAHDQAMASALGSGPEEDKGSVMMKEGRTEPGSLMESSPEVKSLIESILENTLLNITRESEEGEFNITAPHFLVAQQT